MKSLAIVALCAIGPLHLFGQTLDLRPDFPSLSAVDTNHKLLFDKQRSGTLAVEILDENTFALNNVFLGPGLPNLSVTFKHGGAYFDDEGFYVYKYYSSPTEELTEYFNFNSKSCYLVIPGDGTVVAFTTGPFGYASLKYAYSGNTMKQAVPYYSINRKCVTREALEIYSAADLSKSSGILKTGTEVQVLGYLFVPNRKQRIILYLNIPGSAHGWVNPSNLAKGSSTMEGIFNNVGGSRQR